jgi:hypothetical protein
LIQAAAENGPDAETGGPLGAWTKPLPPRQTEPSASELTLTRIRDESVST